MLVTPVSKKLSIKLLSKKYSVIGIEERRAVLI